MKITVFEVEPWERETFEQLGNDHELVYVAEPLTTKNAAQYTDSDVVSTFIYSRLKRDVLEQFSKLSLIATRSTGFDHIDDDYCRERNIQICNVPTYGANTVAEHVFGLLLTLSHHLVEAVDRTRRGDFSLQGLRGFDLRGKTLGVVGTGDIGQCVIEIAEGFKMDVLAYDLRPREDLARALGFRYVSREELFAQSDVISLHVPLNEHTRHLLSTEEFRQMKEGVVIINTARGSIIDIQALLQALAEGKVQAAGLDVLPEEPSIREEAELLRSEFRRQHDLETLLANHILLRQRNVVITPHSAFNTREAVQRILDVTVDNIRSFLAQRPKNMVLEDM